MKKWSTIIAVVFVAGWIEARDFFANETIQYFSSEPRRLLYVIAIAMVGGVAALAIDRLSPSAKRRGRLLAWGGAACAVTTFIGYMAFQLVCLSSFLSEFGGSHWLQLVLYFFLMSVIAAYLWFEFYNVLRIGVSR